MAKNICARDKNYSQWYLDVIQAGELASYAPVKGCMVIRPTGFAIWERMRDLLDRRFKETGHRNAYFPLLIPEGFIRQEAEHIEGFSPELAVVTHAGGKILEEPLVVRPTSETIVGHMYSQWIQSYRDLPLLINQWCNIMRWELRTRLFLRTSEFLWQEGHTAHETQAQAQAETRGILEIYRAFFEDKLAMPVVQGLKTESEKFPGALRTYCVEALMQDGRALQAGTSHHLGQNFAKAFNIQFLDRGNQQQYVHTTSWGVSTRMIGGLIMTHSDDDGLVLPPNIAPTQMVLIPLWKHEVDQGKVTALLNKLQTALHDVFDSLRIAVDLDTDLRPAERFFYWIQQGVPLRVEIGPRDADNEEVVLVRRDTRQKTVLPLEKAVAGIQETLLQIQTDLYAKALAFRQAQTHFVNDYKTFTDLMESRMGFAYAHWDGTPQTEQKIKEETKATIRCIPLENEHEEGSCIVSGKPSKQRVLFAQAY